MFKRLALQSRFADALDVSILDCKVAFEDILKAYDAPNRHYHNVDHLLEMWDILKESTLYDQASLLAIFYHDIVYDVLYPYDGSDEHTSSDVCYDSLIELGITEVVARRARFLIQLTAGHIAPPGDELAGAFLDADMAILGSATLRYVEYTHGIAGEYVKFPDYIAGRIQFLESLLKRDHIYHTAYFRERFAAQALINITNELRFLKNDKKFDNSNQ